MQETLDKYHQDIIVDAVSYYDLDNVQQDYDFILLAPQASHKYLEFKQKYGNKVMTIDASDFASGNVAHVINETISKEERV